MATTKAFDFRSAASLSAFFLIEKLPIWKARMLCPEGLALRAGEDEAGDAEAAEGEYAAEGEGEGAAEGLGAVEGEATASGEGEIAGRADDDDDDAGRPLGDAMPGAVPSPPFRRGAKVASGPRTRKPLKSQRGLSSSLAPLPLPCPEALARRDASRLPG
jgi:hypothetical protein